MATSVAPETGDTLSDINTAMGAFFEGATDIPPVEDDDALDAELDAKHGAVVSDDGPESPAEIAAPETPVPDPAEAPATEPTAEVDPLANAKPFEYTVNGEAKSYDGIKVLSNPDGSIQGAIIPAESIKDVQYRLQRQEYLETQNKALYDRVQDFDRVAFTAPDGKEYAGLDAVQQLTTEHAKLMAAAQVMASVLESPEKLVPLALAAHAGDQSEIQRLSREVALNAREAAFKAREQWTTRQQSARQEATQTQQRTEVTRQAITSAVQHWASQFPALTKDDLQRATAHFEKLSTAIVRPATPDEATQAGVKPGELVIDHQVIHGWLADRAELRAQQANAQRDVTTKAQQAALENARRLAAAAPGKSGPRAPSQATKPRTRVSSEPTEETWQQQRDRMMRGEFTSADDE